MTLDAPSRRGLFRGATGLAAVAVVGCPRPAPLPPVAVGTLLAGFDVSEAALAGALRSLQAAGVTEGEVSLRARRGHRLHRDLGGPRLVQTVHRGTVVRIGAPDRARERSLGRIDDATVAGLLEKLGVPGVPPAAEADPPEAGTAVGLAPVPLAPPVPTLPELGGVAATLALLVELLRAGAPEAVAATWEDFTDDVLTLHADGRLVRRTEVRGRGVVSLTQIGAAGRTTVEAELDAAWFQADPSAGGAEQVASALVERGRRQAEASAPGPTPGGVLVSEHAAAQLVVAAGPGRTPAVWDGAPDPHRGRRARFDTPVTPTPRTVAWSETDVGGPAHAAPAVEILALSEVTRSADGSLWGRVSRGRHQVDGGPRPLPVGVRLRVPLASLASAQAADRTTLGPTVAWTGPPDARLVVESTVPELSMLGCTLEAPHVG